ncbi:MAG: TRAP transporter fused permease subunit [Clostridia bacterium]|nr:TRAP transporter fused permease subunit [Clostridia bacterium]MBO7170333.1 TRAP transporter fused permease subunit [Clostridia bacterium]
MAFFKKKPSAATAPMDLDDIMKKYDRESTTRVWDGVPKIVVTTILALFSLMCIYVTFFATWLDELRLTTFMAYIIFIGYMVFPAKRGPQRKNYLPWYDILLMVLGAAAFLYFAFNASAIIAAYYISTFQVIVGIVGIVSLVELCRRSVGLPILIVAGVLLVYALFFGLHNPDFFKRIVESVRILFYSKEGVLSTPVNVCSKYIVMFIIFGAFLERTGVADFFINISNALVGRFSGGPAKVAVVASAMEGMVSGSSVANTVGSGAVTIPLMKKTGYKPEFAAAAEASASTGGQIMPPIMGAAAFLMAETVGVPYSNIVVRAILPAILYFAGVFITVHLEAKKEGLRGLSKEELPRLLPLLKKSYLLLPLIILIYLVGTSTRSIAYAAVIAIGVAIVVSLFNKENRITPKRIWEALAAGAQGMITVAVACGIAGIIAGLISATGLAYMLFNGIVAFAGNHLIIALFLTMLCCIVLGMGVPTTANYCIMAATCAPILVQMGVPMIAAHFFVFYFGIVADLTPPVALAAYAGAAIAQANPMKTAFTSTKLAIGAFIVPYVFALNPAMLFIGTNGFFEIALIIVSSLVGIFAVSAALEGYILENMKWYERLVSVAGGLLLIYPGALTDLIGLALVAVAVGLQVVRRLQKKKAAA